MQRSNNNLPFLCLSCNGIKTRRREEVTGAPAVLDTAVETLPQRDQDEIEAQETCPICLGELVQYNEDTGEVEHMYTLFKLDHATPQNPNAVSHWYHQICLARYVEHDFSARCPMTRQEISFEDKNMLVAALREQDEEEEYNDDDDDQEEDGDQEEDDDQEDSDADDALQDLFAALRAGAVAGPSAPAIPAGPARAGPLAGPSARPAAAKTGGRKAARKRPLAAKPKPARPKRHKPTCSFLCISVRQLGFTTRNGRPIAPTIPHVLSWATFNKTVSGGGGDFPVASVNKVATGRLLTMPFANSQKNFSGWCVQTAGQFAS